MTPESSPAIPTTLLQEAMRDKEMLSRVLGIRNKCLDIVSKYGADKRNPLRDRVGFLAELAGSYMIGHTLKLDPDDFASFSRIRTVDASVPLGDGGISAKVKIESFEKGRPRESKYIRVHVYDQSSNPGDLKSLIILISKDGKAKIRPSRFTNAQVIEEISKVVLAINPRSIQASSSSAQR